jgi:hypothetical protein
MQVLYCGGMANRRRSASLGRNDQHLRLTFEYAEPHGKVRYRRALPNVELTDLCLSCAAKAYVPMPRGATVAATTFQVGAATFATGVTPRSQWSCEALQRRAEVGP